MRYIIFILITMHLSSCITTRHVNKTPPKVTYPMKVKRCIKDFLEYNVSPENALKLCESIYKRQ